MVPVNVLLLLFVQFSQLGGRLPSLELQGSSQALLGLVAGQSDNLFRLVDALPLVGDGVLGPEDVS